MHFHEPQPKHHELNNDQNQQRCSQRITARCIEILRLLEPNTVKKKLGKNVKRPSISDKKTDEYRAKKGLPPIKRK